ncbi:MAG: flagellar protein FliS [Lentisphaeria bacterium]|jgi:flagellar protein FliS
MAVTQTKAAAIMQEQSADMTSHAVISLLLAGGLERVSQAKQAISQGKTNDKIILMGKIRAIINGLRNSLNFDDGGEIAVNLSSLYVYMIDRIDGASEIEEFSVVNEVGKLLVEVKEGWDAIDKPEVVKIA